MRTHLLYRIIWSILNAALAGSLFAHEDTRIQLKSGALIGLPERYTPAELDLKASRIRIGNHAMTFSPFLKVLFEGPHELEVWADWTHEPATLPPYILLRIQPEKKDFSYELLLNLDTLDVIKLSVVLQTSDSSKWHLPIALDDQKKKDIKESIQTLK